MLFPSDCLLLKLLKRRSRFSWKSISSNLLVLQTVDVPEPFYFRRFPDEGRAYYRTTFFAIQPIFVGKALPVSAITSSQTMMCYTESKSESGAPLWSDTTSSTNAMRSTEWCREAFVKKRRRNPARNHYYDTRAGE